MTAITFLDKLTLSKADQDAVFKMAQKTTGSSGQSTYFITNYEHGMMSYEVDRAALHILDSALVSAERFIQHSKQKEWKIMNEGKVLWFSTRVPFEEQGCIYATIVATVTMLLRNKYKN